MPKEMEGVNRPMLIFNRILGIVMSMLMLAFLIMALLGFVNKQTIIPITLLLIGIVLSICGDCEKHVSANFARFCIIASFIIMLCGAIMLAVIIFRGNFVLFTF